MEVACPAGSVRRQHLHAASPAMPLRSGSIRDHHLSKLTSSHTRAVIELTVENDAHPDAFVHFHQEQTPGSLDLEAAVLILRNGGRAHVVFHEYGPPQP